MDMDEYGHIGTFRDVSGHFYGICHNAAITPNGHAIRRFLPFSRRFLPFASPRSLPRAAPVSPLAGEGSAVL